jgi:hypothetical protein
MCLRRLSVGSSQTEHFFRFGVNIALVLIPLLVVRKRLVRSDVTIRYIATSVK